jgi:ATP-dependent DNA helicase 2 subunit 2
MIELENNDEEDLLNKNFEVEPVERDQLVEGFRYGKHTIVLKDLLSKQRTYTTIPGLDIRGVVEASKLPRIYMTKEAILVFGSKESNNDQMAIAALVDVLTEMESYAIARFVKTPTSNVSMCVLIPVYIKKNGGISTKRTEGDEDLTETRAFILNTLPFFEDEKISTFPRLTTLRTTSGKEIDSKNDLLPSSEIDDAMDSLVQKMDLGSDSTDFEGDRIIFNPTLAASLLPLPVSRGNHDNLVKLSTGVHYRERAIKDIIIKSLSYSKGLKEYVKQDNIIPPLPKELEKDTLPDPKPFSSAEYDLKQLAKLVDAKPVDKTKPRKRRVVTDEIDELGMDDDFEELSLDQLLLKGLD